MENRKFSGLSLTVIALLLVAIVGTGVYAYYASEASATANVTALRYAFAANGVNTVETQTFTITVDSETIQPGAQVKVPVTLSSANSDVAIDYTISVMYQAGSQKITNLSACKVAPEAGVCATGDKVSLGDTYTTVFADQLAAGSSFTGDFYLAWPYGDADSVATDTADQNKTVTLVVKVTGQQVNPNA